MATRIYLHKLNIPLKRCKIADINDTYEIQNEQHKSLVNKFIPLDYNIMTSKNYDRCKIKSFSLNSSEMNFTLDRCNEWVFSEKYFKKTIVTDVG